MTAPLFIDGVPATVEDLAYPALVNYGAYTSFAVQDGGVRGLDRHLARLREAALDLFGEAVDDDQARAWMRQALDGRRDAWLRAGLFAPEIGVRTPDWIGRPRLTVGVFAPASPLAERPLCLQPQTYAREAPHLKHVATFGLIRARRAARAAGFDDALFVGADGRISEASVSNIGFLSGDRVIWPQAPMLAGVSQALIADHLAAVGLAQETRPVTLADLSGFDGAFITNSATPACAVAAIGDHVFASSSDRIAAVAAAWTAAPIQPI
jgi:branched-subunit amino acid aminotransferase/4-amino-4-deoxychorismate lyase